MNKDNLTNIILLWIYMNDIIITVIRYPDAEINHFITFIFAWWSFSHNFKNMFHQVDNSLVQIMTMSLYGYILWRKIDSFMKGN